MKLDQIVNELNLDVRVEANKLNAEVKNAYISDLLSDVLANSEENDLWVTLQIHPNIVAIASIKGLSGIVLINSREPEEETIKKAEQENISLMVTSMPAFEFSGKLYNMLHSGTGTDAEGI